tara:strand:- start:1 stop:510 length:510 start_codon:yes stop_codon:yes gene_type:complete
MPVISGKAYWPKLHTPMGTIMNPEDKRYSLDIGNLDKANVKLAKDLGMNLKTDDPDSGKNNAGMKEKFVTLRRYGTDYNGNLNPKPPLVDANNKQLSDEMYRKLGNGSDVNVKFSSKTTKSGFHQFHLEAVQVISLVEYDAPESDEDVSGNFEVVKGGYTGESAEDVPF